MYTGLEDNLLDINVEISRLSSMEIDGETMEKIIKELGFKDYIHRWSIMSQPLKKTLQVLEEKCEVQGIGGK